MINILLALGFFALMVVLLLLACLAGNQFRKWHMAHIDEANLEIVDVAEGAVFALLGLLIAFTFSGAYDRFEQRQLHIIDEANAYEQAYHHVDLVDSKLQPALREDMHHYLDYRIAAYKDIPHFSEVHEMIADSKIAQNKLWAEAVAAVKSAPNPDVAIPLITSLDRMFDLANAGIVMTKIHPPVMIFVLLLFLSILGGFLAGYTADVTNIYESLHIVCYVLLVAFTLYLIVDLELPRVGLIRVDSFDTLLTHIDKDWQQEAIH